MKKKICYFLLIAGILASCGQDKKGNSDTSDNAISKLTKAIAQDTLNSDSYYQRGVYYANNKAYNEAIADLERAISLKKSKSYYKALSEVYLNNMDSYKAMKTLEEASYKFDDDPELLLELGKLQLVTKQYEKAFGSLSNSLFLNGKNAEAHYYIGFAHYEMSKQENNPAILEQAILNLDRAVKLNPELSEAWYMLGEIKSEQNDTIALAYFDNAMRFDPRFKDACYKKAQFLEDRNETTRCIETYRMCIQNHKQDVRNYINLGNIYYEQDSLNLALTHFDLALAVDPNNVTAYFNKGAALESLGKSEEALKAYQKVLVLDPENKEAEIAVSEINNTLLKK